MKKAILLFALLILAVFGVSAQNASRSGFFLELGIGGTIGKSPRVGFELRQDNNLYALYTGGAKFDFALGARIRMKNPHWVYEFKAEVESTTQQMLPNLVCKAFPVSFRYTSKELFRNMSLYATFGVGGAISSSGREINSDRWIHDNIYDVWEPGVDNKPIYLKSPFAGGISGGPAYTVGVGLNITNHLYAGFTWDAQLMIASYRASVDAELLHYGSCGFRLGYRF